MTITAASVNQTPCVIRELRYCQPACVCANCRADAPYYSTAMRTAIDLDLERPVLLQVKVSVHYCEHCHHYFRAQPPFLRPDSIYANQVVSKAVCSVLEDGMAMRRATARLARDFWVQPSEASIRIWCKQYGAGFDFATECQPWVIQEFSGILCVDEVYQDKLALLLAVDPASPHGDQLMGYQLVHGKVSAVEVKAFLSNLQAVGIEPQEVITDGSVLYPTVLAQVWPQAAHQLCLFHETRRIVQAAMKVVNGIRTRLPVAPPAPATYGGGGKLCDTPPTSNPNDAASQRWYWRRLYRVEQIKQVHALAQSGLSQRAIAQKTGHHRKTIKQWLKHAVPVLPTEMPLPLPELAALPGPRQRREQRRNLLEQVQALAAQGLNYSAIARQTGIHRITVKKWLKCKPPWATEAATPQTPEPGVPAPPAGWSSWDEVRHVRGMLQKDRFLLMRRPDHLNADEQQQIDELLASPIGAELKIVRDFLVGWFALWRDADGQRRTFEDAMARFEAWRTSPGFDAVPQLQRVLNIMTIEKFGQLSQYLRHQDWEATNNGVERTGRAFRHRQAAHFCLRTPAAIQTSINAAAMFQYKAKTQPSVPPFHTCQRGRHKRVCKPRAADSAMTLVAVASATSP